MRTANRQWLLERRPAGTAAPGDSRYAGSTGSVAAQIGRILAPTWHRIFSCP
jgi:hypothetical protein